MTGNRQQKTHTRTLKANVPQHIEAPFEFVFIDQGEDLELRVGNSRLSGRRAGDMARFDKPVDVLEITSPYDQVVKLVVGFGEFSRLIVSGELNVSAYVNTRSNGQAKSLPMSATRTIGYDSLEPDAVTAGTEVVTGPAVADFVYAGIWWDGYFYGLNEVGYYKIGPNTTPDTYEETGVFGAAIGDSPVAAAVTDQGVVYLVAAKNLYKMHIGEWYPVLVASGVTDDFARYGGGFDPVKNQIAFLNDYTANGANSTLKILVLDVKTGAIEYKVIPAPLPAVKMVFRRDLGEWWLEGGQIARLDRNFTLIEVAAGLAPTLQRAADWSHDGVWLGGQAGNATKRVNIAHGQDTTYTAKLWTQEGADISTRRNVYAQDDLNIFPRDGEQVVAGPLIKQVMHSLVDGAPENYLDYVTGFSYSDGRRIRTVSSGTESFALRGIDDDFAVKMNTEFTVDFLPEYFDQ